MAVDVTERLNPLAQAKGVLLKTGNLVECYVLADRVYLAQLLTNLVENAIKYSKGPTPKFWWNQAARCWMDSSGVWFASVITVQVFLKSI